MESTCEESVKREKLHKIVRECIVKYRDMGDLLEYREMNDSEWVDREVMCYVLRENVFHLVYWDKIVRYFMLCNDHCRVNKMLSQMHTITLKFSDFEEALEQLIDSMVSQFKTELCAWNRHWKLCYALDWMLLYNKHSLSDQTGERIFDYLVKLIETCNDDEKTIEMVWRVLSQFPFNKFGFQLAKYKASLIKLIINSLESFSVESRKYSKNLNLICGALKYCENLLDKSTLEEIYNYLLKLTELYQEDDEMITQVFDTLSVFPFQKCCLFQFDKFETSLVKLIDFAVNENAKTKENYYKHEKLCDFLKWTLRDFEDSLSQPARERILEFIVKLFETCDDKDTIICACYVSEHFPFDKHQSLPFRLLDSIQNNLQNKEQQSHLKIHNNLFILMNKVLIKCRFSLSYQTCERLLKDIVKLIEMCEDEKLIESYWIVLSELPFDKHQTLLLQLIDLVENKLNDEQLNNIGLCEVMKSLLYSDSFNPETHSRMSDYLMKLIETCDDEKTIESACDALQLFSLPKIQSFLIKALHSTMNNLNSFTRYNWKIDQNLCKIIDRLQINHVYNHIDYSRLFDRNFMNNLFDYLSKLFVHCNHMPTILSSVLLIKKLYVKGSWDDEIMKLMTLLKDKLKLDQLNWECYNNGSALPNNFDHFERYQVNWCVRWCMDNVMGRDEVKTELPLVKLSQDRCEARNDKNRYVRTIFVLKKENEEYKKFAHPVRSSFPVSCGVYYYEVTVITNGKMMFGWSTREARFADNTIVIDNRNKAHFGYNKYSIGFDASRKLIVHNSQEFTYPDLPDCVAGDVIGCLIDCDARRFVFYYKGHEMELVSGENDDDDDDESEDSEVMSEYVKFCVSKRISFSLSAYYVTASLSLHQQCHFNFGQSPFKFVPKNITFRHFHDASGGDGRRYQLNRTFTRNDEIEYSYYWFEHSPVDNQVDLFYCDEIQEQCDDQIKQVEQNIRSDRDIWKWRLGNYDEIEERFEYIRYIQSIIEMIGKVIGDDKVDVIAMWIGNVIADLIYEVEKTKLLELIYPYFQLRINSSQDTTKHRYICIVLSYLIKYSKLFQHDFIKPIRTEVFTYLTRTLTETNDEWTKLFVLIAIDNLKLNDVEKNEKKRNAKLNHLLKIDYHQQNVLQILKSTNKFVDYQVYLCAQLYNKRTFSTTHSQVDLSVSLDELIWQTPLNASDQSKELKLSRDRLSARSDWKWQSVRLTSCDIDYYEVLLLTSGPMRFGWAIKRTDLDITEIGDDQFSIALDGYNRCVWYNKKSFPLRNMSNRWSAGDIVGCRFDKKQRAFYFSLNGQLLSFDCSIYNSSQPYYAAASLYTHQQCYFYLGQFKFNYKLKSSKEAFITNSSLINAIINVNSTSTSIGDVSFSAEQWTVPCCKAGDNSFSYQPLPVPNRQLSHQNMITSSSESRTLNEPSIRRPSTECQLCFELTTFKLLRFVCCNTITLCLDCLQQIRACSKCSKPKTTEESTNYAIKGDQHLECRLCNTETPTKLLQFVCCNSLVICLDCLEQFRACPKCKKRVAR